MKLACFLKVKQKLTGRGCQNNATVRGFKREGKNLRLERKIFWFPVRHLKESTWIWEQTSRCYGGLKLGIFVTKWGFFVQFERVSFGKSTHIYTHANCRSSPRLCFVKNLFVAISHRPPNTMQATKTPLRKYSKIWVSCESEERIPVMSSFLIKLTFCWEKFTFIGNRSFFRQAPLR